ncbi:hypothetical protein CJF42_24530 [Pseudoalteromonas sp. NBT06-2]|uniref:hypothetical protein n=1 Tax=Pseudoalteromonas sp. NBT06-2 TaxID=2025950 RepID=UPI000BA53EBC|nr:hypothetical protein [Pseudoalteromonas sp. NBT06-2]PAJ71838.1 hypothetical protein CJF42_24530 [Pseudoalteromonas sp. NBT06-2]
MQYFIKAISTVIILITLTLPLILSTNALAVGTPTVSLSWSPTTINYGESSTLNWHSINAPTPTSCRRDGNVVGRSGSWLGTNRTVNVTSNFECTGSDGTTVSTSATLTVIQPLPISVSLYWSPSTINYGETSTLNWSSTNAPTPTSCRRDGSVVGRSGAWTGGNRTTSVTSTFECTGIDGKTVSTTANLQVLPPPPPISVSLYWSPSTINYGETSTLNWSSTNAPTPTSCRRDGNVVGRSGSWTGDNRTTSVTSTFECTGIDGKTVSTTANLQVLPPPPPISVSLYWSPSTINYGETSTLNWSSTNAPTPTSCRRDGSVVGRSGAWTGGNRTTSVTSTFECTGIDGKTVSTTANLQVLPPPPPISVSLYWSPSTINYGETSTLNWSSTNAPTPTSCRRDGSVVGRSGAWTGGNRTTSVTSTFECTGIDGKTVSTTANLQVLPPPPPISVSLYWSPSTINYGETSTLNWSSTNAPTPTSCRRDGNVVGRSGAWTGDNRTTSVTSTFECTGIDGKTISTTANLQVLSPPPPISVSLYWSPSTINHGESSILNWSSTNAPTPTSCRRDGNVVGRSGAWTGDNRTTSVTSTFECTGIDGKTISTTANLQVLSPPPPISVSLYWSPSTINHGESSILNWSSTNAPTPTSCRRDGNVVGRSGAWTGDNRTTSVTSTFECTGIDGKTISTTANLQVLSPPPPISVSLYWSPSTINHGESSILNWSSTNAPTPTSCRRDGNVVGRSGAWSGDNRTTSVTSTFECTGIDGKTVSTTANLTVVTTPVLKWNPAQIKHGGGSELIWDVVLDGYSECKLDNSMITSSGSSYYPTIIGSKTAKISCEFADGTGNVTQEAIVSSCPSSVDTDYISIKQCGAKSGVGEDGVANLYALKNAIDFAYKNNKYVYIPAGDFTLELDAPIDIVKPVKIAGASKLLSKLNVSSKVNFINIDNVKNGSVIFSDLTIQFADKVQKLTERIGLKAIQTQNSVYFGARNLQIFGFGTAIQFNNMNKAELDNIEVGACDSCINIDSPQGDYYFSKVLIDAMLKNAITVKGSPASIYLEDSVIQRAGPKYGYNIDFVYRDAGVDKPITNTALNAKLHENSETFFFISNLYVEGMIKAIEIENVNTFVSDGSFIQGFDTHPLPSESILFKSINSNSYFFGSTGQNGWKIKYDIDDLKTVHGSLYPSDGKFNAVNRWDEKVYMTPPTFSDDFLTFNPKDRYLDTSSFIKANCKKLDNTSCTQHLKGVIEIARNEFKGVHLERGRYTLGKESLKLDINDGSMKHIIITGAGSEETILSGEYSDSALLQLGIIDENRKKVGFTGVEIKDIGFENTVISDNNSIAILAPYSISRSIFKDLSIKGFDKGIEINRSTHTHFQDIAITNAKTGIHFNARTCLNALKDIDFNKCDWNKFTPKDIEGIGLKDIGYFNNANVLTNINIKGLQNDGIGIDLHSMTASIKGLKISTENSINTTGIRIQPPTIDTLNMFNNSLDDIEIKNITTGIKIRKSDFTGLNKISFNDKLCVSAKGLMNEVINCLNKDSTSHVE